MKLPGWLAVPALLLVLALAGCGEDESGGGTTGEGGGAAAARSGPKPGSDVPSGPKPGSNVPPGGKTVIATVYEKPQPGIPADVGQWMIDVGVPPGNDLAFVVAKAVAPPGNTNFRLNNPQSVGHDLTVAEVGGAGGSIATPVIRKGSGWVRLTLYPEKRYVFYCSVPGHREAGMEGTIEADPKLRVGDLKPF